MTILYAVSAVLWVASLAAGIACAVVASKFPDSRWEAVGQNKLLFMIGCPAGGLCCWPVGLGFSIWFWLGVKPRLEG